MIEKQLKNLGDLHSFYTDYYNRIKELWYDFESKRLTKKHVSDIFFKIKKEESEINPVIKETIRSKPKRIVKKCKKHTDEYFKQVFNA